MKKRLIRSSRRASAGNSGGQAARGAQGLAQKKHGFARQRKMRATMARKGFFREFTPQA